MGQQHLLNKAVLTEHTEHDKVQGSTQLGLKLETYAHTEQLLAEQLGPVRHIHLNDIIGRFTESTVRSPDLPTPSNSPLDHICTSLALLADVHLG